VNLVVAAIVFICVLCTIEGLFFVLLSKFDPEAKRMRKRLQALCMERAENDVRSIVRNRPLSSIPRLNQILSAMPLMLKLDRLLLQADSRQPLGVFLLLSLVLGVSGFYVTSLLTRDIFPALLVALLIGGIPFFRVSQQKKRRMKKFEVQLPGALELIARSLRAGHAFVGGLQTVAEEFDDPMGSEIQKTVAQINFGVSVEQALKNLTERVDCQDLKFLAVSIIIQRESGGNLGEILESVGGLIRARFTLRGKIRALSAEGILSAGILTVIPFAVVLILAIINPMYPNVLLADPLGKVMVLVALVMMAIGIVVMKKMITIKV
jgi:tight adherence protein B